ncbi:MAG: Long-chain-alcohol dehydrogenase 1 [Ignavibacteria bacterium]|nr:Long-chain-alcohol dehydrogenase 1 [Ignavibacteria bacterium]
MQEEYFGEGMINRLPAFLKRIGCKKIFLVTGKKSFEKSGARDKIFNAGFDFEYVRFSDFTENPKTEDVEKGIKQLKNSQCDTIVAIGGGSVIDMAKLINIFSANSMDVNSFISNSIRIERKGKPLTAIPTTSGAGSEATHFAVLYNDKEKYSAAHEFILPDLVIIDPELTYDLTPQQTAVSGIDALAQAIESHWSVNSTDESKKYSSSAIKLVIDNLADAVKNPKPESRREMSRAANLAGKAINITKTTAPHALSYTMTSYFGVTHGQAVSITLGEFMKYNFEVSETDVTDKRGAEYVKRSILEIAEIMGCSSAYDAADKIKILMKDTGLKTSLKGLGISSSESLKLIAENVNTERLQNNPRKLTKSGLEVIIRNII